MNPRIIKAVIKGYNQKIEQQDALIHSWCGQYGISALIFAIEHCLSGDKAKSKYIEKPLSQKPQQQDMDDYSNLSEEEKKKKTQELFMQLEIMGANFNLNHKGGK